MPELLDIDDIKTTAIWDLFEKGREYHRRVNIYSDTDLNYRMYNGNQWAGAIINGIEKAQYNFIETIVNYKVSTINSNLYAIHFSSENFEEKTFRSIAKKVCELLDKKAANVWEKDQMDIKVRDITEDAAINDEGIMYVWFDEETQTPTNEILSKNDVYYGNEQSSEIQTQPYIIIARRRSVVEVKALAKRNGASDELLKQIVGDDDYQDQAGDDAKIEKEKMCTYLVKMWKDKEGKVWYQPAVKYLNISEAKNTSLSLYPIAHFLWKNKRGFSRGEGEVRGLIPNQLELNKTLARYLLAIKQCAYAQKVVNTDKIANPDAVNTIGGIIKTKNGATVDDVSKIFTYIQPATMSGDVNKVINDLITITRELKNAGDIATGNVNPEDASGKAILAVQQASQQPMNKQAIALKKFIEDLARIWLDMWTVYTPNGMKLEEETLDTETNTEYTRLVTIPSSVLKKLKGTVKIDITPDSPYDKYARELSIENMFKSGMFNVQKLPELKIYAQLLRDNSTMPKQDILDAIKLMEEEQERIAQIEAQAQVMQQRANQFINSDADTQAQQMMDAQNMINQTQ